MYSKLRCFIVTILCCLLFSKIGLAIAERKKLTKKTALIGDLDSFETVEFSPECDTEGVFPHPKNDSRFFRCHSFHKNSFQISHFQCQPGTIFDDDLDLCVGRVGTQTSPLKQNALPQSLKLRQRQSLCSTSLKDCRKFTLCPDSKHLLPFVADLCKKAIVTCQPCNISVDICTENMLFSPEQNECYEDSTSGSCYKPEKKPFSLTSCNSCTNHTDRCEIYEVCFNGKQREKTLLCETAFTQCRFSEVSSDLCKKGDFYAPFKSACYPPPDHPSMMCEFTIQKPESLNVCDKCTPIFDQCSFYDVCPNGAPMKRMELCKAAYNICFPCESVKSICPKTEVYSIKMQRCFPSPDHPQMTCSQAPQQQVPSGTTIFITETSVNQVHCSSFSPIPTDDWIKKKFCYPIPLCIDGVFVAMPYLCTHYYKCEFNILTSTWDVKKKSCLSNMLFDFSKKICKIKPSLKEQCELPKFLSKIN